MFFYTSHKGVLPIQPCSARHASGTPLDSGSGVSKRRIDRSLLLIVFAASSAGAQYRLAEVTSMGQPPRFDVYAVPSAWSGGDRWRGMLSVGIHRSLRNPVAGLLGMSAESYATFDPGIQPGARLLAVSRAFAISAGVDWDGRSGDIDAVFSYQSAILRGGLLGRGTMLRVDWLPGRSNTLNLGVFVPIGNEWAGRTRPRDTDVAPPPAPRMTLTSEPQPADIENALARAGGAAFTILAYTNLYPEQHGEVRHGQSYPDAARTYHAAVDEAFRIAANNPLVGDRISDRARLGLLDHVIIPFDSLFGQVKERASSIRAFTGAAQRSFQGWLRDTLRVRPDEQRRIAGVHARWLGIVELAHRSLLAQGRDSRLIFLPPQLALTAEQYDEQREVDALIERAVGRRFTDQNAVAYLRSADIPLEVARSIFAAREYHVLQTHDFAGQRAGTGSVDDIAFTMVADAYLPALTQAVQRYDSTRRMPAYNILIDQYFYEARNNRLWMDILENPLHASMDLPGANADKEAHLRRRQLELRDAVRKSWRLGQDASANGGDHWLRDVIKVNVSVLLPSDFSFRSHRIVPPFPFVPDNIMRDHRKMVFYDLTPEDPYRGALIVMGVGIGEHYATPTWEDRAFRLRGPAALEARAAARRSLMANGIPPARIPYFLQDARSLTPHDSVTTDYIGRALQVHNEAGFGPKESSVARAMLYNLAPPGSVIIVPDPVWVSDTWAAMLAGAAARGCRVFVVSPATANSPNPQSVVFALNHDVMLRLMRSAERLRDQLQRSGGELRVGLFTARAPVTDAAGRLREVREGLRAHPWIRSLFPFDDATLVTLDRAMQQTQAEGGDATRIAEDETPRAPKLHQKTQLIARPGAIAALVRQPGWENILAAATQAQSRQSAAFADQLGWQTPDVDSSATRRTDALIRGYEANLSESDRRAVSFYFVQGTQNHDPRGLMLDAEATVIVSGVHAAAGLVDLYYIMARSAWVTTKAELDRLLPRPGGLIGRIARMIRFAI